MKSKLVEVLFTTFGAVQQAQSWYEGPDYH
jgi:hypothetical protein